MGFRFRRRLRVMPGVHLNLSKSGVSTSIGRRGATLNLSSKGTRTTVGLPGTGLSYQSRRTPRAGKTASSAGGAPARFSVASVIGWILAIGFVALLLRGLFASP